MARPGVTYQDVARAANIIKDQNKNVTIENVRAILGTGSIGTINNHLRKWKETENITHKTAAAENIPEELQTLLKNLWKKVMLQSVEHVAAIEESNQLEINKLKQELEKYKNNNKRWQNLFTQWQHEKNQLLDEQSALKKSLAESQKLYSDLFAKYDLLLQKLKTQETVTF